MFVFFHGYSPDTWDAMVRSGLVGNNDGIRFPQNLMLPEELKFNCLARKGGKLYNIIKERNSPFYIDRLQGGGYIDEYVYDESLLGEYKNLLGDKFYGFQMHEWFSNYYSDTNRKLSELSAEEWTEENIKRVILGKFPYKNLFLESMTLEEMATAGKPLTVDQFYDNMTAIYKKRQKIGDLLPCDSAYLAYQFEIAQGANRIMPEVGAQTKDSRLQICYARGMTRRAGRSFGIYYEPWGGEPFSTCSYYKDGKNEWGWGDSVGPFEAHGKNGGSSRSLQKRIFLYGYLSGAEFISEEWGLYNTFLDGTDFGLSPYGEVKRDFLNFVRKYDDIGDKLSPIAAVLPEELTVLDSHSPYKIFGYESKSERLASIKKGVAEIFASSVPMLGSEYEQRSLRNSDIPDAIDLLNRDDEMLKKYDYLVDLTFGSDLKDKFPNICEVKDIAELLRKLLPVYVDGGLHWMVNECKSGGYYLTVFNHSGVVRSVTEGEYTLPEAEKTVTLSLKGEVSPDLLEGDGHLLKEDGVYRLAVPAGGFAFIKLF